ncbi:MAG: Gfo/Idh/MocA family oxidoreductase [Candidatus Moduliflexus flocculans]|nr:Gfo/Idh/MocA family oxidoreductase [Candidatus Moduliflexus flocculans]
MPPARATSSSGSATTAPRCWPTGPRPTTARSAARSASGWRSGWPRIRTATWPSHLWGIGNHGGGPSRKDLRRPGRLMAKERQDLELVHSTPGRLFRASSRSSGRRCRAREKDLNPWAVGCYTSMARVKQGHRRLENELYSAEKMVTTAWLQGLMPYPSGDLEEVMRDLAFVEFHDILPGSAIPAGEEGAAAPDRPRPGDPRRGSRRKAFFALAAGEPAGGGRRDCPSSSSIPTLTPSGPWSSASSSPGSRTSRRHAGCLGSRAAGGVLPSQAEKEESNLSVEWRKQVVFEAELAPGPAEPVLVPARAGRGRDGSPGAAVAEEGAARSPVTTPDLAVSVDARTGLLDVVSRRGRRLPRSRARSSPLVIQDNADPWGMKVRSFRAVEGRLPRRRRPRRRPASPASARATLAPVRVIEDGEVRTVVEAILSYGASRLVLRYERAQARDRGRGRRPRLLGRTGRDAQARTDAKLGAPRFLGQVAFGADELPSNGDEAVAQKWLALVSEADGAALTVVNDGTHGSDWNGQELRLSLLRSPAYAADTWEDRLAVAPGPVHPAPGHGRADVPLLARAAGLARSGWRAIGREALVRNEAPYVLAYCPPGGKSRLGRGRRRRGRGRRGRGLQDARRTAGTPSCGSSSRPDRPRRAVVELPALGGQDDGPAQGLRGPDPAVRPADEEIRRDRPARAKAGPGGQAMTSKERVAATLEGRLPDQVPYAEFAVDFDTVERLLGHETYLRAKAKSQIAFWEGRRRRGRAELARGPHRAAAQAAASTSSPSPWPPGSCRRRREGRRRGGSTPATWEDRRRPGLQAARRRPRTSPASTTPVRDARIFTAAEFEGEAARRRGATSGPGRSSTRSFGSSSARSTSAGRRADRSASSSSAAWSGACSRSGPIRRSCGRPAQPRPGPERGRRGPDPSRLGRGDVGRGPRLQDRAAHRAGHLPRPLPRGQQGAGPERQGRGTARRSSSTAAATSTCSWTSSSRSGSTPTSPSSRRRAWTSAGSRRTTATGSRSGAAWPSSTSSAGRPRTSGPTCGGPWTAPSRAAGSSSARATASPSARSTTTTWPCWTSIPNCVSISPEGHPMGEPVSLVMVGVGGMGAAYLQALLERKDEGLFRIAGAVDPQPNRCKQYIEMRAEGVPCFVNMADFYRNRKADLAVVSSPIQLHMPADLVRPGQGQPRAVREAGGRDDPGGPGRDRGGEGVGPVGRRRLPVVVQPGRAGPEGGHPVRALRRGEEVQVPLPLAAGRRLLREERLGRAGSATRRGPGSSTARSRTRWPTTSTTCSTSWGRNARRAPGRPRSRPSSTGPIPSRTSTRRRPGSGPRRASSACSS